MFSLTARRASRFCGRIWAPTGCGATLPPLTPGWRLPLHNGVSTVRNTSIDGAPTSPVRSDGVLRHIREERKQRGAPSLLSLVTPKPKTEAWYDFFLSDTIFGASDRNRKPHYRYGPLRVGDLRPSVPEALRDCPLAVFDGEHASQANVRLVHECLELYISKVKATPEDPIGRQRYVEDAPGAKALLWSMSLPESDRLEVWSTPQFRVAVVHRLVTEKNTEALWHWLELDDHLGPKNPALYTMSHSARWKQMLLRNMVETQVYWSDESDCVADAMATVVKAFDNGMLIVRDAAMFVYKVTKKAGPTQSEEVYDRFTSIVKRTYARKEQRTTMIACLDLFHPTRPDTSKWMQLLRSDPPFIQNWYRPLTYPAGLEILGITCNLARKCAAEGRRSDATWVLDHAYERVPYLFSGGPGLKSFHAKVRNEVQRKHHFKPSVKEIKRGGTIVGKDGEFISRAMYFRKYKM